MVRNQTQDWKIGILNIVSDSEYGMIKFAFPKNSKDILLTMQCKLKIGHGHQLSCKTDFQWVHV